LTRSAGSCGHGWTNCGRWPWNTSDSKRLSKRWATDRRVAGQAHPDPSGPVRRRPARVDGEPTAVAQARPLRPRPIGRRVLALVRDRPGISKGELKDATGLPGAGVAQNLRRPLARGEVREEALPGGAVGFRLGGGDGAAEREPESVAGEATVTPKQAERSGHGFPPTDAQGHEDANGRGEKADTSGAHAAAAADSDAQGGDGDSAGSRRDEPTAER